MTLDRAGDRNYSQGITCRSERIVQLQAASRRQAMCSKVMELSHAFIDNELDGALRSWVDWHLGGCADCLVHVEQMRSLKDRVHTSVRSLRMPDSVVRAIRAQMRSGTL